MKTMLQQRKSERGFTLVELAIVLVIIGLIIGGVLVGQDLIKAAEIRATVAQVEKYNAAVNTFRNRFNGLPGDLRNAADFGTTLTAVAADTNVLGDRILTDEEGTILEMTGELTLFWQHLSEANLIDGSFAGNQDNDYSVGVDVPRAKIDRSGIGVYGDSGYNFFQIGVMDQAGTAEAAVYGAALTPNEAYNIDVKVDDGSPLNGQTIAQGDVTPNTTLTAGQSDGSATSCTTTLVASTALYTLDNEAVTCQLRLRMN